MSSKLKILMVHDYPPLEGGGLELNTSRLSEALTARGHSVTIATSRFASETFTQNHCIKQNNIQLVHLTHMDTLDTLIGQHDIVHVHATFSLRPAMMHALRACHRWGRRAVVTLHTSYDHISFSRLSRIVKSESNALLDEFCFLLSSPFVEIITPSASLEYSLEKMGIKKQTHLIRNGIAAPQDIQLSDTQGDILFVGEVSNLKGVPVLLRALKKTIQQLPHTKLTIAGSGEQFDECVTLSKELGIEKNVVFLGYVQNKMVWSLLKTHTLFVLPSHAEASSTVIVEAMTAGTFVIASNIKENEALINNNIHGATFHVGDDGDLAKQLTHFLRNAPERKQKTIIAKRWAHKKFSLETQAKNTEGVYELIYDAPTGLWFSAAQNILKLFSREQKIARMTLW